MSILVVFCVWQVGYCSLKHLLPAFGGTGMLLAGGFLSWERLCSSRLLIDRLVAVPDAFRAQ